jgi:hypothetical protein
MTHPRIPPPRWGPSRERDLGTIDEFCRPCAHVDPQPPGTDRPACQAGTLTSAPGHGPFGPWPRYVRVSAESTATCSHRSNWCPNRHQQPLTDTTRHRIPSIKSQYVSLCAHLLINHLRQNGKPLSAIMDTKSFITKP